MNTIFRQTHRVLAVLFTLSVVATTIALAGEEPVVWMSYVPLFPLALLLITGLYLFVLPYTAKRRAARGAR